ncbi:MAG: hypothetical protein ACRD3S_10075, partial [Terracidiphilus sp.]
ENEDAITKFNPTTKEFTTYQLPDHGTDVRQIAIAYSGGSEVVYAAYSRENEIVGLQIRTAAATR